MEVTDEVKYTFSQFINFKEARKKLKHNLIRQKALFSYSSDETEDGVETESDFFISTSFSESGEEADVEDFYVSFNKAKVRRKTSTSSKNCDISSTEELDISFDPINENISSRLPECSRECPLEECRLLRNFNQNASPFTKERSEDLGLLGDEEDCNESDTSDRAFNFFISTSFSDSREEEADIEGVNFNKAKVKSKYSTSFKNYDTSSKEELDINFDPICENISSRLPDPIYENIRSRLPNCSHECPLEEGLLLRNFNKNASPFIRERFEDLGTLGDEEDCNESDRSDKAFKPRFLWNYFSPDGMISN